jgi:hypothetical protein
VPIRRSAAALTVVATAAAAAAMVATPAVAGVTAQLTPNSSCQLDPEHGQIKHVIYLQFDNVHLTRDNPNVPSDLEQMPNLLNFLTSNGTVDANHHTPLIAHTANDILTSLTGVYGDRHGQPIANSYRYYLPNANHDHSGRQGRAGAMGQLHPRRLRLGRRLDGQRGS